MVANKLSRLSQIIQTEWSFLPDVFQMIINRWHLPQVDLIGTRFNKLPQFLSPVPGPPSLSSGFTQPAVGGFEHLYFPTSALTGKGGGKTKGLPIQENHPDSPRVAQHALVWGSGGSCQDRSHCACPTYSVFSLGPSIRFHTRIWQI